MPSGALWMLIKLRCWIGAKSADKCWKNFQISGKTTAAHSSHRSRLRLIYRPRTERECLIACNSTSTTVTWPSPSPVTKSTNLLIFEKKKTGNWRNKRRCHWDENSSGRFVTRTNKWKWQSCSNLTRILRSQPVAGFNDFVELWGQLISIDNH